MSEEKAKKLHAVAVYCGSSAGRRPDYAEEAAALGRLLAEKGIRLIYGGGKRGLMGALAQSALAAGGEVIGVIPAFMTALEWGNHDITALIEVQSMAERKQKMFELADAVIALPGGVGTLEEFSEILSASQLLLHRKAVGFLNTDGYYDLFFRFIRHMTEEGFCPERTAELWMSAERPEELLRKLAGFHHHGRAKTLN